MHTLEYTARWGSSRAFSSTRLDPQKRGSLSLNARSPCFRCWFCRGCQDRARVHLPGHPLPPAKTMGPFYAPADVHAEREHTIVVHLYA